MINLEKLNRKSVTTPPPPTLYRRRAPAPHFHPKMYSPPLLKMGEGGGGGGSKLCYLYSMKYHAESYCSRYEQKSYPVQDLRQ